MKKIKLITFIVLIIALFIILLSSIFGTNLSLKKFKDIKKDRIFKENFEEKIKINNTEVMYDKITNTYFYMVSDKYENQKYMLKLELDFKYKYKIKGCNLNIIKIEYDKPIEVIIYDKNNYYNIKIQLTNLPLVNIETDNEIGIENENTIFTYINENLTQKKFINNAKIKVRGSTSQEFDKKNYRINFYNKSYSKEEKVQFSNFYIGDSLILDSVYRDQSKIRNLLSINLWNDISNDFSNVNIYSEFVELFINNEYKGLYILTEPVNRTKFNLNKSSDNDSSFVVKSTLGELEIKYPNKDIYDIDIIDKIEYMISDYFKTRSYVTYEIIEKTFDLNNYIDIIIFNYFINNLDNRLEQNVYYYNNSLNDEILYIQPWDMEWSFGLAPGDPTTGLGDKISYDRYDCYLYHPNAPIINELLIKRYWELRKNVLTEEYLYNLIDNYLDELNKGATLRDSNKWYEYNIEEELNYIKKWIANRIEETDKKVKEIENDLT